MGGTQKNTDLLGLQNAAKAKGLEGRLGVDRAPAIAHLWDNHFVAVEQIDADNLLVFLAYRVRLPTNTQRGRTTSNKSKLSVASTGTVKASASLTKTSANRAVFCKHH